MRNTGRAISLFSDTCLWLTLTAFALGIAAVAHAGPPPIVDVAPLDSTSGSTAVGGIVADKSGNFFGTSFDGAASGFGSVWELPRGSNKITTLDTFNGANGEHPAASPIIDGAGNIFGTTQGSGDQQQVTNYGTVYEIASGTSLIQPIATFTNSTGRNAGGGLVMDSNGNLFGTTLYGGASNYGTVFEITKGSHTVTPLASFNTAVGYNCDSAMLIDSNGNLFGMCSGGGDSNHGSIFELPAGGTQIVKIASFAGGNSGSFPQDGLLRDSKGNLFGATTNAGDGEGTIFELPAGSSTITTLAVFGGSAGHTPNYETLVMDGKGDLFGTAEYSDAGYGTIWELPLGSTIIYPLATFDSANGNAPTGTMVTDANGDLFGTTLGGGQNGDGVVWEMAGILPEPSTGISLLVAGAIVCCFAGGRRSRRHAAQ